MAAELWNRVNIPFPSTVSSVRVPFSSTTDVTVKALLVENEKVLKLYRSEILQTEIRVLYELLYVLNNSYKNNKTFKALKQVEQCINRLKIMKLNVALQDLTDLCPTRIQRGVSIKTGECDVPSQPYLEWLCLKVLGAIKLLSCTLNRCSTAFILSRRQMKWEEFVILNMVITSMLSRLWVIFRGILSCLCPLYEHLLELLKEVANSQPMPFLTDFTLPTCVTEFLSPSDALVLTTMVPPPPRDHQPQGRKTSVKVKKQKQTRKHDEDLGVAVERAIARDTDLKPFLNVFNTCTKGGTLSQKKRKTDRRQAFKKQVREAKTFADLGSQLEKMITWFKSHKRKKETRLLNFLSLKCRRMKCLEAEGYNFHRKLQTFKQEASSALSHQGCVIITRCSSTVIKGKDHLTTRFHSLRSRFKSSAARARVRKKPVERRQKEADPSASALSGHTQTNTTAYDVTSETTDHDSHDDIDNIFASIGW